MHADIFEFLKSAEFPPEKVIFEIGAADGEDTLRIMDEIRFSAGRYFVIEPEPANIQVLVQRPQIFHPGVMLLPVAVGDRNALVEFHRSSGRNSILNRLHTFSGSLKQPTGHLEAYPWCKFNETVPVQMVRLDDLASLMAVDRIDFIWCDIQGAEDLLITGGQSALAKTSYLYTEYSDKPMYDGQIGAEEIQRRLPGEWEIVEKWPQDILFHRLDKPPFRA